MLITVMSEGELHVPRLGRVAAAPGFRLVAAMNPFDAVGTARISAPVYDRTCRLLDRLPGRGRRGRHRRRRSAGRGALDETWVATRGRARAAHPQPTPSCGSARRCAAPSTPSWSRPAWPRCAACRRPRPERRPRRRARRPVGPGPGARGRRPARSEDDHHRAVGRGLRTSDRGVRPGKSWRPDRGHQPPPLDRGRARPPTRPSPRRRRRTTSRRELARHAALRARSRPRSAQLDEAAFDEPAGRRPGRGAGPAGRPHRRHRPAPAGAGPAAGRAARGRRRPAAGRPGGGASAACDAAVPARRRRPRPRRQPRGAGRGPRRGAAPDAERPAGAGLGASPGRRCACVVDRSGSMGGRAAGDRGGGRRGGRVPGARGLQRAGLRPRTWSSPRARTHPEPPEQVVSDLLALRGFGTTDLALRAARRPTTQLAAVAGRPPGGRAAVGLPGDGAGRRRRAAARRSTSCASWRPPATRTRPRRLAASVGARFATVDGPSEIPDALAAVLGD